MTTYSKETALYNTGAIGDDIQEAGTTATSYLTDISGGGVFVHSSDTPSSPTAENAKGVQITDKVDIIRNGESVAEFGETARVGKDEDGYSRLTIDPYFEDGATNVFKIQASKPNMDYSISAHEVVLNDEITKDDYRFTPFNTPYTTGSIGSASSPLYQSSTPSADYNSHKKTLGSTTFTINEISNLSNGTLFKLKYRVVFGYKIGNNTYYFNGIISRYGPFEKGSTPGVPAWTVITGTLPVIRKSFARGEYKCTYTPSNNSFVINDGFTLGNGGTSSTVWVEKIEIYGMEVYQSGILVPIHNLTGNVNIDGDMLVNGSVSNVEGTGDLKLKGNIYVNESVAPIGWYDAHTGTADVNHNTDFQVIGNSAIDLNPSNGGNGRYLLFGSIRFDGNATGYRGIAIRSANSGILQRSTAIVPALGAAWKTRLNVSCFYNMGTSHSDTIHLCGLQNKGSGNLSCDWDFYAVKIR